MINGNLSVTYPYEVLWAYGWPAEESHSPIAVLKDLHDMAGKSTHSPPGSALFFPRTRHEPRAHWLFHPAWPKHYNISRSPAK